MTNAYDGFGRAVSSGIDLGGVTRTLSYVHDRDGNRMQIAHPGGAAFDTVHDGLDRPYYLGASGAGGIGYAVLADHGAVSALHRAGAATGLGYDGVQRPAVRAHYFAGGGGNVVWSHAFNPASGLASETRDNDGYAWQGHYAVNRAYTVNGLNRYIAAAARDGTQAPVHPHPGNSPAR